jgi:hypothetical protein
MARNVPRFGPSYSRASIEVPFMMQSTVPSDSGFVYPAHVSLLILRDSETEWSTYLFQDTYFDKDGSESCEVFSSPLAEEHSDSQNAIEDPREFFLRGLSVYMHRIMDEWRFLIVNLEEAVDGLESNSNGYEQVCASQGVPEPLRSSQLTVPWYIVRTVSCHIAGKNHRIVAASPAIQAMSGGVHRAIRSFGCERLVPEGYKNSNGRGVTRPGPQNP